MEHTCHERVVVSNGMVPEKLFQLGDYGRQSLMRLIVGREFQRRGSLSVKFC